MKWCDAVEKGSDEIPADSFIMVNVEQI